MGPDPNRRTDNELLTRFDARFRGPLMSFFLRRVGNRAEAEDLTQDVFVRLMGAAERDRIEDAESFVFKIAANLLRDRHRRTSIRASAQLTEIDDHLVSGLTREFVEYRHPERVLLARVQVTEVLKALDELGVRTKDIYVLFRLEAMKQREIADLYGLTVKSIEKHVMRATLHLALRFGANNR